MLILVMILVIGGLGYFAYQSAFTYIAQYTLEKIAPGDGSEVITGWKLLLYGWPFLVIGLVLSLIVLPLVKRSYRAANHADLKRAIDRERTTAQRAQVSARDAQITAYNIVKADYAERLRDLSEREAAHEQAVRLFEAQRKAFAHRVEFFEAELARAAEDVEKADKAKENAVAASARHRKKVQKLQAELKQLMAGETSAEQP